MKSSEVEEKVEKSEPVPEFTPELRKTMRTALRLWFLLDRPQYADEVDMELYQEGEPVLYARQGRDCVREINVAQNFHRANRSERGLPIQTERRKITAW